MTYLQVYKTLYNKKNDSYEDLMKLVAFESITVSELLSYKFDMVATESNVVDRKAYGKQAYQMDKIYELMANNPTIGLEEFIHDFGSKAWVSVPVIKDFSRSKYRYAKPTILSIDLHTRANKL